MSSGSEASGVEDGGKESGNGLRRFCSSAALVSAFALVIVKFWAWHATGSIALLTSALDALVDVLASLATFASIRYSERPADRSHRFGHGKGEAVAALVQAILLAGAALTLGAQSIMRLLTPQPLMAINLGIWLIVGSLLVAVALVALQTHVLKRTRSTAITADRAHYLTDIAVNAAVLLALGVSRVTGWTWADPDFAMLIGLYMLWNAHGIALQALRQLLDRELSTADRNRIKDAALGCHDVRGIHDLRTRDAGDRVFIELHLEIDGAKTIAEGHAVSDTVEDVICRLFPNGSEVTVHIEPAGILDDRLDHRLAEG